MTLTQHYDTLHKVPRSIMLSVVMLSVTLFAIMLSVVMLSVVMLNVVVPLQLAPRSRSFSLSPYHLFLPY